MVWTVVYVAPTRSVAERLRSMLEKEGFLPRLRPVGLTDNEDRSVEILVPESEVDEATELLGKAWAK